MEFDGKITFKTGNQSTWRCCVVKIFRRIGECIPQFYHFAQLLDPAAE